ncbi:heterokaryon incompatibility protein-domain-containing protein [Phascolomyces articulosus]|uniref:Heterokaryon incompatibility protein-domain-containing protein n=1 Tax=Phascolomyces articulosus TaxID=60185 RepID=A0AAD5PHA8_9FUNG|nr:heterokaryon incompatibility protein-domain-containing protein [Phascolomyces articulosus]
MAFLYCTKTCSRSAAANQTFNGMIKGTHIIKVDLTKKMLFRVLAELLVTCHTSLVRKKTTHHPLDDGYEFGTHVKSPITIPNDLPKPDFMPTKLVRISDMKVVDGSQANESYCALSYSWNQSGDMVLDETTGKYKRIDKGKHRIFRSDDHYEYVKFEGLIQQICQQFNIKYIWYDQLCINQDNKEEKHHEIRNMHHIYENAYCTVALVPDSSHKKQ